MSLPIKKIYIDTRFKTSDSKSSTDFKIDLPNSLYFPSNSVFYIDDIAIPHSWYTIEENVNDKLYIYVSPKEPDQDNNGVICRIIKLNHGNYTGADLSAELNLRIGEKIDTMEKPNILNVNFNARHNTISISTLYNEIKFKILTMKDIKNELNNTWFGPSYNKNDSQDINDILRNNENFSIFYDRNIPYKSGVLDLQLIRNIYFHSPNLGTYNTIGALGESSIIKKIPVTSDYNQMIFDQVMVGNDFLDCSKQTWRQLEFSLRDVRGNVINLHGSHISFSIIFSIINPNM